MQPKAVWIAPPPRPPRPAWVKQAWQLDEPLPAWVPGTLVDWRMVNPDTRDWTGLVRWSVHGLTYEQWLPGTRIRDTEPGP